MVRKPALQSAAAYCYIRLTLSRRTVAKDLALKILAIAMEEAAFRWCPAHVIDVSLRRQAAKERLCYPYLKPLLCLHPEWSRS